MPVAPPLEPRMAGRELCQVFPAVLSHLQGLASLEELPAAYLEQVPRMMLHLKVSDPVHMYGLKTAA